MKDDQNLWNFIFAIIFLLQVGGAMYILYTLGRMPTYIPLFDFSIIVLATFRLARLFVYDKITQFVRDWFLIRTVVDDGAGTGVIIRQKPMGGPGRTIADLLDCPWCFTIWAALAVSFLYFLTPFAWFPIFMLAISGLGTFVMLLSNMIGWRAEELKQSSNKND